jgi:chromosome segregation ATPase
MRRSLDISCSKRDSHEKDMDEMRLELERVDSRIESCSQISRRWETAQKEVQNLQTEAENLHTRIADKRASLEIEYNEPDDYLTNQIENFDTEMQKKQQNLQKMQRQVDMSTAEIAKLRSDIDKLNTKRGEAQSFEDQFSKKKIEQAEVVGYAAKTFGLSAPKDHFGSRDFDAFMRTVNSKLSETASAADAVINEWRSKAENASSSVQHAKGEIQRVQLELGSKEKEISSMATEKDKLHQELLGGSKKFQAQSTKAQAEEDFQVAKKSHDDFMIVYTDRMARCKNTLKETSDRIRILTEEIANDDQILQVMRSNRSELDRIGIQEKQAALDEQQCQKEVKVLFDVKFREIFSETFLPASPDTMQTVQLFVEDRG